MDGAKGEERCEMRDARCEDKKMFAYVGRGDYYGGSALHGRWDSFMHLHDGVWRRCAAVLLLGWDSVLAGKQSWMPEKAIGI